jgi:hypothetical protein
MFLERQPEGIECLTDVSAQAIEYGTSAKRVPVDEAVVVERLYRERYEGWNASHFHERLVAEQGFRWGYT